MCTPVVPWEHASKWHLDRFSRFVEFRGVPNTHHGTYDLCSSRPHLYAMHAMWCNGLPCTAFTTLPLSATVSTFIKSFSCRFFSSGVILYRYRDFFFGGGRDFTRYAG